MTDSLWMPDEAVRVEFLERWSEDLAAGVTRTLSGYQTLFPGFEEVIEDAWNDIVHDGDDAEERVPAPSGSTAEGGATERLGPYELLKELGRGGQGTVHLARDTRLGRTVALKLLKSHGTFSDDTLKRFHREGRVASRLNHPGICPVHETGIIEGTPYIAMAYVEGQSLATAIANARDQGLTTSFTPHSADAEDSAGKPQSARVRSGGSTEGPLAQGSLDSGLLLFEKAARALHAAHEAGVIHRDIKPGNIMVTRQDEPVLLDFGLARSDEDDLHTLTRTGDVMGTPAYMPPELILGRPHGVDRRSDVYSLGVVMFESFSLTRPFTAPTREGLYQAILTKSPPNLRELNPAIPPDFRVICETAIEKNPDRRYQTALDLAEDLKRCREVKPIQAKAITGWTRVKRWAQRNPAVAASLALASMILVGGIFASQLEAARADRKALESERNAAEATANLRSWRRMADVRLLEDLEREAEGPLWPAWPDKVPLMERWLDQAHELVARSAEHRATLAALRATAAPYTAADRAAYEAGHPKAPELEERRTNLEALTAHIATSEREIAALEDADTLSTQNAILLREKDVALAEMEEKLPNLRATVATLEAEVSRRPWMFADRENQYRHQVYTGLVEGIQKLTSEAGALPDVTRRLAFASHLEDQQTREQKDAWDAAIARVAQDARFVGFALRPQYGLVPLGKDVASGLEEFGLLGATGEVPRRNTTTQRLEIGEATGLVFVLIPGGSFAMGSQRTDVAGPNFDPHADNESFPVNTVTLRPFFISKFEMTQQQWLNLTGDNPSFWRAPKTRDVVITMLNPVEQVSWNASQRYLRREGLTLPTEAQWEYAARARTETLWWCGNTVQSIQDTRAGNISDLSVRAFTGWDVSPEVEDGFIASAPVGSFAANPFGLHDVLGNVGEWCQDRFSPYAYTVYGPDGFRQAPDARSQTYRGGSFYLTALEARSARRFATAASYRNSALGIRPARPHL